MSLASVSQRAGFRFRVAQICRILEVLTLFILHQYPDRIPALAFDFRRHPADCSCQLAIRVRSPRRSSLQQSPSHSAGISREGMSCVPHQVFSFSISGLRSVARYAATSASGLAPLEAVRAFASPAPPAARCFIRRSPSMLIGCWPTRWPGCRVSWSICHFRILQHRTAARFCSQVLRSDSVSSAESACAMALTVADWKTMSPDCACCKVWWAV